MRSARSPVVCDEGPDPVCAEQTAVWRRVEAPLAGAVPVERLSDAEAAAFDADAAPRRVRFIADSVSGESSPEKSRLKKQRNASTIRFK